MWEKVRGVFLMPSNEKNATNFFPYLICPMRFNIVYKYKCLEQTLNFKLISLITKF